MIELCLKLYFLAQVLQILHKYNSSANKYRQHSQQLYEYARYKGLPETIKRRITNYYDFKYQKHFYKESEILGTITPQLLQRTQAVEIYDQDNESVQMLPKTSLQ